MRKGDENSGRKCNRPLRVLASSREPFTFALATSMVPTRRWLLNGQSQFRVILFDKTRHGSGFCGLPVVLFRQAVEEFFPSQIKFCARYRSGCAKAVVEAIDG